MIYASSPAYHKDYLILPKVASILVKKYGLRDFKIHYTIPDRALLFPAFQNAVKEYGVENYFVNHGIMSQQQLAELFSRCDLGLFPSVLETFSGTLLEYMYFGLPIVASDLDFNKEVAKEAAAFFEPHNAEDFAEKIYTVYSNHNYRDSLLKEAATRLDYYSNNADKYEEKVNFLRVVASKM